METLKRVMLHNPIQLGKKNMGMRLDVKEHGGLRLINDADSRMVYAEYNGDYVRLPHAAVAQIFPADPLQMKGIFEKHFNQKEVDSVPAPKVNTHHTQRRPKTAQVSGPHDHVFKGQGAGKTSD